MNEMTSSITININSNDPAQCRAAMAYLQALEDYRNGVEAPVQEEKKVPSKRTRSAKKEVNQAETNANAVQQAIQANEEQKDRHGKVNGHEVPITPSSVTYDNTTVRIGDAASPDGVHVLSNGSAALVQNGVVTSVTMQANPPEAQPTYPGQPVVTPPVSPPVTQTVNTNTDFTPPVYAEPQSVSCAPEVSPGGITRQLLNALISRYAPTHKDAIFEILRAVGAPSVPALKPEQFDYVYQAVNSLLPF